MPLSAASIQARVNSGKPFIVGIYIGMSTGELSCKVKGNPNLKENRVICKHTVMNKNGMHVFSEFLQPGAVCEKDKTGQVTRVLLADKTEKVQLIKDGTEVVVDLFKFARDGVGYDIMGEIHPTA